MEYLVFMVDSTLQLEDPKKACLVWEPKLGHIFVNLSCSKYCSLHYYWMEVHSESISTVRVIICRAPDPNARLVNLSPTQVQVYAIKVLGLVGIRSKCTLDLPC